MLFYAALQFRIVSSPSTTALKVPIVDLELDAAVVLASGPAVLSFLVLVITGSMRALNRAIETLGCSGEELDIHPNAIDLAFYMTPQSPRIIVDTAYFVYMFVMLLGLGEAGWLWWHMVEGRALAWVYMFAAAGGLLWIPAVGLVLLRAYRRIRA